MTSFRKSPAAPQNVQTAVRARDALELRMQGLSLEEIAGRLQMKSKSGVHKLIHNELREIAEERKTLGNLTLDLELERLDRLERALSAKVDDGDVRAIEASLKIGERRAKLLGLDQPQRHEHVAAFTQLEPDALLALFDATTALPGAPSEPESEAPGETAEPQPE